MISICKYPGKTTNLLRVVVLGLVLSLSLPLTAFADEAPTPRQQFIETMFQNEVATEQTLWLDADIKKDVNKIMGHKNFKGLRVRYHQGTDRDLNHTVWVLEEIGKYMPITVGISIRGGTINKLSVLTYRESHGWEVKHDFFTHQFVGAKLEKNWKLDENIDGISGATLSVRALKKLARLALYFDGIVQDKAVDIPKPSNPAQSE